MKKRSSTLLYLFSILLLLSCKQPDAPAIGTPTIKAGTAKITGKITSSNNTNKDRIYVKFFIPHPISGEQVLYDALIDQSGKFSIDVDVETDINIIGLYTSLKPYKPLYVKLKSSGVTNIDIAYNSNLDFEKIDVTPAGITHNDMTEYLKVMRKMIEYRPNRALESWYNKNTDIYLNHVKNALSERLEILINDTLISKELKGLLSKDFSLLLYRGQVFNYPSAMRFNYLNITQDEFNEPAIQKIDRSYFRFLKDFNLNNQQYLICSEFLKFQKAILQNETLGLPEIGESDIPSWLAKVKTILSDLVGFKDGQYYDILAANAYSK